VQWTVTISKNAKKGILLMPQRVRKTLAFLIKEIELTGPVKGNWPNYSKLGKTRHHCHLKKGNPTYVAVWKVIDKEIRLVEIQYAGTHEKAPY
jgi:hypothetical protein